MHTIRCFCGSTSCRAHRAERVTPFRKTMLPAFRAMMKESSSDFGSAWARHISLVFSSGPSWHNARNFAVLEGGKITSVFSLRREVQALVIYFLLIRKNQQGRGIGTAVIHFAEKEAKKSGASFLRLDAYASKGKGAMAFYKKLGFKIGGRVHNYEEAGDNQVFLYKKV